jgi:hypothetical protein
MISYVAFLFRPRSFAQGTHRLTVIWADSKTRTYAEATRFDQMGGYYRSIRSRLLQHVINTTLQNTNPEVLLRPGNMNLSRHGRSY